MFKFINNRAMREVYRLAGDDYSNIVVDDYDSKIIRALTHLSGLKLCNKKSLRFMAEELESYAHSVENKLKKFNGQNLDDYEEFKEFAKELTALEKATKGLEAYASITQGGSIQLYDYIEWDEHIEKVEELSERYNKIEDQYVDLAIEKVKEDERYYAAQGKEVGSSVYDQSYYL